MKVEKKICKICEKRRVTQDDWKTEEEKEICFTCYRTWYAICSIIDVMNAKAMESKMNVQFEIVMRKLKVNSKK